MKLSKIAKELYEKSEPTQNYKDLSIIEQAQWLDITQDCLDYGLIYVDTNDKLILSNESEVS